MAAAHRALSWVTAESRGQAGLACGRSHQRGARGPAVYGRSGKLGAQGCGAESAAPWAALLSLLVTGQRQEAVFISCLLRSLSLPLSLGLCSEGTLLSLARPFS